MSTPTEVIRVMAEIPRVALTRQEAARALGCGLTFFEERVMPELAVIRIGSKVLVPIAELQRWARARAERVLPEGVGRDG